MLEPAPEIPAPSGRAWAHLLMLLPMLAGSLAIALIFASQRGGPLAYLTGGLFGISAFGMIAMQLSMYGSGASKQDMHRRRREFLWDLDACRRSVRKTVHDQRAAEYYRHPDPSGLWSLVGSARLWERRATDLDFCLVRLGLGPRELATRLVPGPATPPERAEPVAAAALRRFLAAYREVPDLPVVLALNGFGRVYVQGDRERCGGLVRAMLAQAATFHAPDDLLIGACVGASARPRWEWLKWLPHCLHPTATDALGPLRLVAPTIPGIEAMLEETLAPRPRFDPTSEGYQATPQVLIVVEDGDVAGADYLTAGSGVEGVTIIDLSTPPPRNLDRAMLVLDVGADGTLAARTFDGVRPLGRCDALSLLGVQALAHQLAPLRFAAGGTGERAMNAEHGLADLLGIDDARALDPAVTWAPRSTRDRLRVPIGIGADGSEVELDLKESAQDGMGPHGLLIGATGSGKSELLRTLVLALAVTHSPETLNFVLVDFKGGATFAKLDKLPHTSAVITNLADELPLVDRMTDAVNGEIVRREELLRAAGNYVSQREYERARAAGAPLAPLPSLFVVCDEFSELLSAKPDFIDLFVQIGRLGRSLGVHLLLASQRLEEGRLRGLDTHLSYRIGLRTFSPSESRAVLGVVDAYELPRAPGHGFMKVGTEMMTRFRAAYVSGAYYRRDELAVAESEPQILEYTAGYVAPTEDGSAPAQPSTEDSIEGPSLLDIVTDRLAGRGTPAHQVWLPPLADPPTLDQLTGQLAVQPERGLQTVDAELTGRLRVPVAIVDRPFEQRQERLVLDLSGAEGHAAIIGAPQSGKSTLLRTLVCGLALTHTPREVQLYCLDFSGGTLTALRGLPHVGGVATRRDVDQVRRTVAEVVGVLHHREQLFVERGIDSMATYRRLRRSGQLTDEAHGDVFLIVDGWMTLRNEFESVEEQITDLANRGLSYGIHLVAGAGRWFDLRGAVRDVFGTRLELRLGDPSDSAIDRRAAANVPEKSPGRGVTAEGYQCLAALPRIDGVVDVAHLADGTAALVDAVRRAWPGAAAPAVRLLPDRFDFAELPQGADEPGIAIGVAERDLRPVRLDPLGSDPHFILFGDNESGKSSFLRAYAHAISQRYPPQQARIIAIDYRRSLLGGLPESHVIGYGSSNDLATALLREAAGVFRERLPGPEVTPEQLRARNWWTGADLYVLVDDYDLVAGDRNPLLLLVEFLAQAREIGLHVVVARRTGGASRAFYDPVLGRLRDLATPGLIMSGDRDEGVLLGSVRPGPLPPGRGWLVTRREGARLIQCGWIGPAS